MLGLVFAPLRLAVKVVTALVREIADLAHVCLVSMGILTIVGFATNPDFAWRSLHLPFMFRVTGGHPATPIGGRWQRYASHNP